LSSSRTSIIALIVGIALIGFSIYFFMAAVSLISPPSEAVVASLLSAIIGFVLLSAGTTLIRTYVVARVAEKKGQEGQ
jgi:uncharacterized membrane protein YagU involved in acid resistance